MTYTDINFKTKKALKEAVKAGKQITCYEPGGVREPMHPQNGKVFIEGPHSPKPHTWYAEAILKDGVIVSVK